MANKKKDRYAGLDEDSKMALLVEQERIAEEEHAVVRQSDARKKLIEPYTDGLPYNRDRIIGEAKKHLYQSFTSAIECGRYLIWLQEEEGVQTLGLILNQHFAHVSRATAFNFMRLARVSVEHPKLQHLAEKQRSKAIALLEILDEKDLQEYEETDSIAGMTLDEVEKMPARQLKDELRAYTKKIEKGTLQLREAEDKIKALQGQVEDLKNPKLFNSKEEELLAVVTDLGNRFELLMLDIQVKTGYSKESTPDSIKKKLIYLLLYMQRELSYKRVEITQFYDGDDDMTQWDPDPDEIPADLHKGVPHLEPLMKKLEKRKGHA